MQSKDNGLNRAGCMRILNKKEERLLKEERQLLSDLRVALAGFGAEAEDQETLGRSIAQLDELFLLVIVGEFNAGKSAFINAMLGQSLLKEGVTPTTTRINVLRYGQTEAHDPVDENMMTLLAPIELLTDLSIVDTPGTNAIIREHEVITSQFVPRSDLVVFITSADRPFTESERVFLERIRDWGKKVLVVVNKIDILQHEDEINQVMKFISENAHLLLGITPEIFPVSARDALRAKKGEPTLWEGSRFEALERYIFDTLDDTSRVQLKILNPLGVGSHLVEKYLGLIESRLGTLKSDFDMLDDVEGQLVVYKEDMTRDFEFRMADIENILYEMEQKGQEYFDETIRFGRVFDLLKKDRIQREFEERIVADVPDRIDQKVTELIDWLVESDLRQWQAVMEHVSEHLHDHRDRVVGEQPTSSFQYDRQRLIEGVGQEARRVVKTYDKAREAQAMAVGAQTAVAATAAIEVGAVSLGTIVTIMATTMSVDVTGVLAATTLAALGLFVIPNRRRKAKQEMHAKVTALREKLIRSLRTHFETEINRSLQHINEAIAPYSRFVRAERRKLQEAQGGLDEVREGINRLQVEVEELGS
jgi:small GTP-binding protein